MENRWFKNAVIYCLDVDTYRDGNGDGVGDFIGLRQSLSYLAGLGVNCVWLLPFYPSPGHDNGYDITDYINVDPVLGDLGDFVAFMHEARDRGIRVIIDLVVNHTSNQHPWFQAARRGHPQYRDYYVWRKDDSLLNALERLIRTRKEYPEVGAGTHRFVENDCPRQVFAHACEDECGNAIVALHNFANEPVEVTLRLWDQRFTRFLYLFDELPNEPIKDGRATVKLRPYGFSWLRLKS